MSTVSHARQKRKVLLQTTQECYYCCVPLSLDTSTIDHIVPKSKGGSNDINNYCLCCYQCNQKKRTMSAKDYLGLVEPAISFSSCLSEVY
jgi:5-methylcytosine-specific restriction endonuclease McrA